MADAGKAPEAAPVAETPATPVVKESAGATLIKAVGFDRSIYVSSGC